MIKPRVCVLRTAGTNCDQETAFAFAKSGAAVESVHVNKLLAGPQSLSRFQILALPGGFTYGDDIAAGKILANELRYKLLDQLLQFIAAGKLIIGICNGFQILVKSGLLPGNSPGLQEASLTINDSAKFEARWCFLRNTQYSTGNTKCVWTRGLGEIIYLPVAHGEGKFVVDNPEVMGRLKSGAQIVFQYCGAKGSLAGYPDNPNGSEEHIAGICDPTGRVLGLMPHPERYVEFTQHPRWTGLGKREVARGLEIFKNGVEYVRKHL